jgi:protein O-GlcNAc transferase
VDEAVAA